MPWKETCLMDERLKFIGYYLDAELSISALCREFGISRKTGYKYINRHKEFGLDGLKDQSRAPRIHPNTVSDVVEEEILLLRSKHPRWGPRKLRAWLLQHKPGFKYPASSTIGDILKRHGLTVPRRQRHRCPPYSKPFLNCGHANDIWCADFKGWFKTGDGCRCDPLTISDANSRFLLRCQHVKGTDFIHVKPVFEAAFLEYGLPRAIRTDNGPPFATITLGGFSQLSIWWIKLGIVPERIDPGKPSQNGRHERMHRTLKEETTKPPKTSLRAQQRAFDIFRDEYNFERPHEAIEMHTPGSAYTSSNRPYPLRLPEIEYPDDLTIRKIHHQGDLKWRGRQIYFSKTFAREYVGLKQIDDRYWNIYFGPTMLARLDDFKLKISRPSITKKHKNKKG